MSELIRDVERSRDLVEAAMPEVRRLDMLLRDAGQPSETNIILAVADPRAYYVGQALESFDREFRRTTAGARGGDLRVSDALAEALAESMYEERLMVAASIADDRVPDGRRRQTRESLHGIRPDPPGISSLSVVASEPGSSLLLLEAVGVAISVMASDPMTALVNAAAWSGPVRRIRAFLKRRGDPLEGISARQALSVLSEFGGDPEEMLGPADRVLQLDGPEVQLPGGFVVKGSRRIHLVHRYADGSVTWVDVE